MKLIQSLALAAVASFTVSAEEPLVEMFSYSQSDGHSGLRVAWRMSDSVEWTPIGKSYNLLNSDFGPWGSHKTMFSPRLMKNRTDGRWVCVWQADRDADVFGVAYSPDLCSWLPQRYFTSLTDIPRDIFPAIPIVADTLEIEGTRFGGYRQMVEKSQLDSLIRYVAEKERRAGLYAEACKDDPSRYSGLREVSVKAVPDPSKSYTISDKLIGIFFEDISHAADGGLYAELIQNRDFEYCPNDRGGWNPMTAWKTSGSGFAEVKTQEPIHKNNPHYIRLQPEYIGSLRLENEGFDGIAVRKGEKFRFSVFARADREMAAKVLLMSPEGKTIGKSILKIQSGDWKQYDLTLKATGTSAVARLVIEPSIGSLDLDMISLFPYSTFKGRRNGLRKDLAEVLEAMHPRFVRFPGGCVAHGDGVDDIYDWKGSIGPLHERKPLRNIWNYHQTRGLGYHEYFLFCEDIGAEPLPVLAAGVPCQNSGRHSHHSVDKVTSLGQQNGIPMEEMDQYIQDVLDLVEYANGDVSTVWGAKRAAAGHPEPFNLKYIGIGNEDMITEVFEPRFKMIYDAVRNKYPEITVVGTVGPFFEGTDYVRGWELADSLKIPIVDEHYYVEPGWLVNNRDFYDSYKRGAIKVYLGEWAAHLPGRPTNVETALAEALYLTDIERNGDVVEMTSYAPLFAKRNHTNWNPDLIYFDNENVKLTPDYYVQKLYGNYAGSDYIPVSVDMSGIGKDVAKRIGLSLTRDNKEDSYILKMVNMLPVKTKINIDTAQLGVVKRTYDAERIQGNPTDSDVVPTKVKITLPDVELPPYSFTVVRIK